MATYKVPQNVEAEDKLLGPFTFKQFIFLLITAFAGLVTWLLWRINPWASIISIPFVLLFGFLGVYRREDQPVEVYLFAALNYFFKPKKRKWDQEGLIESVRLTAPKVKAVPKLKSLSSERGQLTKLAHVMDTRGWSIKRPELTEPLQDQYVSTEDRLAMPEMATSSHIDVEVHNYEDPLDPYYYADADKYSDLAKNTTHQAKAKAIAKMKAAINQPQEPGINEVAKTIPAAAEGLAMNDQVPISEIAKQARRLDPKAGVNLSPGQEIDLPNR